MPQLREIVSVINTSLQGGNFATRKFQDGKWYNIAEFITREEQDKVTKFPVIIDDFGECTEVVPNDTYPIQFYHRILGILPTDDPIVDFGNFGNSITEVDEMVLIVIGDRKKTNVTRENIASAIWAQFPREITTVANLQSCLIEPLEINNDRESVWNGEFDNVDFELEPQQYIISLRYRITAIYSKNCFTLCN